MSSPVTVREADPPARCGGRTSASTTFPPVALHIARHCRKDLSGGPAVVGRTSLRPVTLRPRLSPGLPFSDPSVLVLQLHALSNSGIHHYAFDMFALLMRPVKQFVEYYNIYIANAVDCRVLDFASRRSYRLLGRLQACSNICATRAFTLLGHCFGGAHRRRPPQREALNALGLASREAGYGQCGAARLAVGLATLRASPR